MASPTFSGRSRLVRYVDEVNRLRSGHPAVATFLPDPPSENPDNDHLSVNSLEIESMAQIAAYHRWRQGDNGQVALCEHQLREYNDTGKKFGVDIFYDQQRNWKFTARSGTHEDAYRYRPVPVHNNPLGSPSHCGVEFVRAFKEHSAAQFARRMSRRRFHLL